jgi:CarD family transcriptional regulator
MPSKKKSKSSETQDTSRLKKKGKSSASKTSATKTSVKTTAAKSSSKKTAAKTTTSKNKSSAAQKTAATKSAQPKSSASKKATAAVTKNKNSKNKGASSKSSTATSKAKESSQAVTKKPAAQKTASPAKSPKPSSQPAKATKATPISPKNNKHQDSKNEIKSTPKVNKEKVAAPSPSPTAVEPPSKPVKQAAKATKKSVAQTSKATDPIPVRPKIALASGSSAPQSTMASVAPLQPANDEIKSATETKISAPKPAPTKNGVHRTGYRVNEYIVYPAHGVGQIIAIEEQEVAGFSLELFVINFMKDKMTLKVPLPKVLAGAIRKLADAQTVSKALETLTGRARIKRTMWSRRAQEYEAKINSGDLGSIAEVVRDLYRSETQPEQSYSERQLYEAALDRMMREIAAIQKLIDSEALKLIESHLQRGPKRGSKAEANDISDDAENDDADLDLESDSDGDVEEAA